LKYGLRMVVITINNALDFDGTNSYYFVTSISEPYITTCNKQLAYICIYTAD